MWDSESRKDVLGIRKECSIYWTLGRMSGLQEGCSMEDSRKEVLCGIPKRISWDSEKNVLYRTLEMML